MEKSIFRARQEDSRMAQSHSTINELGICRIAGSIRMMAAVLFLFGCALLNYGCADDGPFLPPPENPPPGQSAPSDDTPQPLQPPTDL